MAEQLRASLDLANKDDFARIHFIMEIDKMKSIYRKTLLLDQSRYENDAEHSWHLAMLAMCFGHYRPEGSDLLRIIEMVLIHDIVEIDAGDTFAYDEEGYITKEQREIEAAERIYSLLPEEQGKYFRALWDEFEERKTDEARFAVALDRLQPLLAHVFTEGVSWKAHHVKFQAVWDRMDPIREMLPTLWPFVEDLLKRAEREHVLE